MRPSNATPESVRERLSAVPPIELMSSLEKPLGAASAKGNSSKFLCMPFLKFLLSSPMLSSIEHVHRNNREPYATLLTLTPTLVTH